MSESALYHNLIQLGIGIEACIERKAQTASLILIYSAIDITAWLNNDDPDARVGKRFMAWVDAYILKVAPLPCSAIDLYAARCGLLHTLTPESDLSNAGKARLICYAWGKASGEKLQALTVAARLDSRFAAVHIEALYKAWRDGLGLWIQELEQDPPRAERVRARAGKFFENMSIAAIDHLSGKLQQTEN
jgi:hypothetical protein